MAYSGRMTVKFKNDVYVYLSQVSKFIKKNKTNKKTLKGKGCVGFKAPYQRKLN